MLLRQPLRFLLADDPGAGKTIMAGLLLKELKVRGLVKRTLIVTPANLSFQWQREMKEKFREPFEVIRSDVLRANYGQNPWQEKNQVITSISWVSRIEDAKESLLRSRWDLSAVSASNSRRRAAEPTQRAEAVVDGVPAAELAGQVAPGHAGAGQVQQGLEEGAFGQARGLAAAVALGL